MTTPPPAVRTPSWPPPPDPPELPVGATPTSGRPPWRPWTSVLALLLGLAGALAGSTVIGIVAAAFGASLAHPPPAVNILATAVQDGCFIAAALFFARTVMRPAPWQFGLRPTRFWPALGYVVAGYLLFLGLSAGWVALVGIHSSEELPESLGADKSDVARVAVAILVCVVAPISEEFLFRGYFFPALRNWKGLWPAALITGGVFGLIHVLGTPIGFIVPLAVLGTLLCLIYVRTKSLYPCIGLHCLNNSVAFGAGVGWDWQIPLLFVGSGAAITLAALVVRRTFGPAPPHPAPV